ncbi:polysaccharide lyase family 7 protein [Thalassotalea castellviae]|uniref:Polysaccharide lyase family 7 protein n=1 Tax=Thalassotalea castellviae TaxID=3075612 RepID=A0ABU3A178_9GAMM|nr:polysaccharide lyase family 7 protein [Thalassotalea sp. W431]MDT0602716.1 polysaccharide lyase family 7 protein [Thalassotalea sp. W431]
MLLRSNFILISLLVLLQGCGSSSSSDTAIDEPIQEQPTTPDTPDEVVIETISCSTLNKLDFTQASVQSQMQGFEASQSIDGSFIASSRWSTSNNQHDLILTLDEVSLVKGLAITWLNNDERTYSFDIETSQDKEEWLPVLTSAISNASTTRGEYVELTESSARYVKIVANGSDKNDGNHIVEVEAFGCRENKTSSIELNDWYLSIPVDESTNSKAKSIYESTLNDNYFNAEFFFLDKEGGMVFRAPIEGAKTSTNTKYTRTELREMLRRGNTNISTQGVNKNNWVFSSAPASDQSAAGGVDGTLTAELAVNYVTETGDSAQVGRVIIGQIHANDDEPIRVYYRKLPNNEKGAIYLAHEIKDGDDTYYELIGTRSKSAENPANGIKLNERFGYQISVSGNILTFTLTRDGQADLIQEIDMNSSSYDLGGQYMYFKAGVYNQNNSGDPKDYVQATFYKIENSHINYDG